MCAACIDFKDPDAPPVAVIIADIKAKRRAQLRAKWLWRLLASVSAFYVFFFTVSAFDEGLFMLVYALLNLYLVWWALKNAESAADALDHTKQHLRMTEALVVPRVYEDPDGDGS